MTDAPLPVLENRTRSDSDSALCPLYKVIFLDDPVTTMEFVVRLLVQLFGKDLDSAVRLMYEVHNTGSSHVDTLPLERAEFKRDQVHRIAKQEGFPFQCVLKKNGV